MVNDFLDNLGARQYEKMRDYNATKEKDTTENYYNSESEGKDLKNDSYQSEETFINTCEETFGKKDCHEETYRENFWSKIIKLYKKIFDKETSNN